MRLKKVPSVYAVAYLLIICVQVMQFCGVSSFASKRSSSYTPRNLQKRQKHSKNRKQKYYWKNATNLRAELNKFWEDVGANPDAQEDVLVPNERLLTEQKRHDLRAAIASNGGRENMEAYLGGARILPGDWDRALHSGEPEIDSLLEAGVLSKMSGKTNRGVYDSSNQKWTHKNTRKPVGFWSRTRVVTELYEYVDKYQAEYGRPSVWMPRLSELSSQGSDDLKQAIVRYGGTKVFCRLTGMVPHQEWFYFEGQLEMLQRLKDYLDRYHGGDYTKFPVVSDIRANGDVELHRLIQYYGGRKFVASRFGFGLNPSGKEKYEFCWGSFDLVFAIELMKFVRKDHMLRRPPLKNPVLGMPTETRLLADDEENSVWLSENIQKYGGFENVARRLGLAFF